MFTVATPTEARPIDIPSAFLVLKPPPGIDPRIRDFDRELLTAWLNFANGGIDLTDQVGVTDHVLITFADEVSQAEALRVDPSSTKKELDQQRVILEKFNHLGS